MLKRETMKQSESCSDVVAVASRLHSESWALTGESAFSPLPHSSYFLSLFQLSPFRALTWPSWASLSLGALSLRQLICRARCASCSWKTWRRQGKKGRPVSCSHRNVALSVLWSAQEAVRRQLTLCSRLVPCFYVSFLRTCNCSYVAIVCLQPVLFLAILASDSLLSARLHSLASQ